VKVAAFIGRRLAGLLATLVISSLVIYGAMYLAPGNPLAFLSGGRSLSPDAVAELRAQYRLDDPFLAQYWHWITNAIQGDLGQSITFRQDVADLLSTRIPVTAFLVGYTVILVLLFGIGLGVIGALRGGKTDMSVVAGTSLALATPPFVAAVLLIYVFGVQLDWLPTFGAGTGFADRFTHMTLPAIALALANIAYVSRVTRAAVAEELDREHVETARSRGIPERLVIRRHVLRNAAIPITTVGGIMAATLIAGAVVVEQAFALGGIGSYLVDAVNAKDFAVVQALCLILVTAFVVMSAIVDVLYGVLDPRIGSARGSGR
jgi:peptide/nickel transport system permease protein